MEVSKKVMKVDYVVDIVQFQLCQLSVVEFNFKSPCVMGPYSEDWAWSLERRLFCFVCCVFTVQCTKEISWAYGLDVATYQQRSQRSWELQWNSVL